MLHSLWITLALHFISTLRRADREKTGGGCARFQFILGCVPTEQGGRTASALKYHSQLNYFRIRRIFQFIIFREWFWLVSVSVAG